MVFGSSIRSAEVIRPKKSKAKRTCLGQKFQGEANNDRFRPKIPRRSAHSLQPTTTCFGPKQQQQLIELKKTGEAENFKPT